ncbi:MAG: hypothetical protein NVSMB13_03950 [Mycobacteriales bacterium]
MSRLADRLARRLPSVSRTDGFTLIEVLVAITLLAVVAAGLFPLLVTGVRASVAAKYNTQASNLSVERIEQMRNLTWHVAPSEGQYVDLLDSYFTDATNAHFDATHCVSGSYAAATYTCQVKLPPLAGTVVFGQVVQAQFLDDAGNLVTPPTGYDSQVAGSDTPPANTLGVTVTTNWSQFGTSKSYTTYTRISAAAAGSPLIVSQARASALRVSSTVVDAAGIASTVQLEAGAVNADGAQSTASSAAVSAAGATASQSTGATAVGASLTLRAPPNPPTGTVSTVSAKSLGTGCTMPASFVCFADTSVSGTESALVSQGLPLVANPPGTATGPLVASVLRENVGNALGFEFSNAPTDTGLQLQTLSPMVFGSGVTTSDVADTSAYLSATSGPTHNVTSGVTTSTQIVDVLPTTFTPLIRDTLNGGIVELALDNASLTCQTSGGVPSYGTSSYSVRARYWDVTAAAGLGAYSPWITVTNGSSGLPDASTISMGTNSLTGAVRHLSDYLTWQALTSITQGGNSSTKTASASLDGIIRIATAPTRSGDPSSVINVSLGTLGCSVMDAR